ncbi:hypothetical protein DFH28DRAFT_909465 [Melampsora americana]|nr:hypothetical protein DFH28DRAFT_909465 [Melampsora americana]
MISDRFDPNIPGVSKQAMLDWMHINRPMTFIKKNANKNEVAQKVREAQPELFPDPFSEEPLSLDCHSMTSKNPNLPESSSSRNVRETEGVFKMKRSSSPGNQPPHKKRVLLSKSCLSRNTLRSKLPEALDQGAISADGKLKRKIVRYKGLPSPKAPKETKVRPFHSTYSECVITSGIVKLEDQKSFHNRQKSDPVSQSKPNPTIIPSIKPLESADHITQQSSQPEPLVSLTPEDTTLTEQAGLETHTNDLIFFSDLDLFELENIDILPIVPNWQSVQITPISSSLISNKETESNASDDHNAKRSGVNVFQDERRRSLQCGSMYFHRILVIVSMLEDRMDSMEKKIDLLQELQARVAIVEEDIQAVRERIAWVEADNQQHTRLRNAR